MIKRKKYRSRKRTIYKYEGKMYTRKYNNNNYTNVKIYNIVKL